MLCCAVLCCHAPQCIVLCCAMLCCAALPCAAMSCAVLCYAVQCHVRLLCRSVSAMHCTQVWHLSYAIVEAYHSPVKLRHEAAVRLQVKQFATDPWMDQGPMRVRTGCAFRRAFTDISKGCQQLTLPICLIASQTDKVSATNASSVLYTLGLPLASHWCL